jgi:hypothetical protein
VVPKAGKVSIEVVIEQFGDSRVRGIEEIVRSSKALMSSPCKLAVPSGDNVEVTRK